MKTVPKNEMTNAVGMKLGPSDWIELSQQRINAFADCTEDHQFIHVDEAKAKETPFGGTIAHGFLTLSLLAGLIEKIGVTPENTVMGMNYGFDKIRFLAPVKSGKRVRMVGEVSLLHQAADGDCQLDVGWVYPSSWVFMGYRGYRKLWVFWRNDFHVARRIDC